MAIGLGHINLWSYKFSMIWENLQIISTIIDCGIFSFDKADNMNMKYICYHVKI